MKKKNKTVRVVKETRYLKYAWTPEEIKAKGAELAQVTREIGELEDDAKRVNADFKAKITARAATAITLSNDITTGYTMRNVMVEMKMDTPTGDKKTVKRLDTGDVLGVENMSEDEKQEILDFEKASTPEPPAPTPEEAKEKGETK